MQKNNWTKEKTLKWLFDLDDEEEDFEYVNIRKLPRDMIDQLKKIDEKLRPNKTFNLPLWIRVSMQHFIEDFKNIKRKIDVEDFDDDE